MDNIQAQLNYFQEHKEEIIKEYEGLYIVIAPDMTIDAFPSMINAYTFGIEKYGLGNFLLKECTRDSLKKVHIITPRIVLA